MLIGENRSTRSKICPSATLSTTNITRTGMGSNSGLWCDRLQIKCLRHATVNLMTKISLNCIYKFSSYRIVNALRLRYKNQSVSNLVEFITLCSVNSKQH
jgi:hypothetical protein